MIGRRRPPPALDASRHADRRQSVRCRRAGHRAAGCGRQNGGDPAQGKPATASRLRPNIYQARHLIENFFAKLKQFRAIATRYDKTARNFLAAIHLTAGLIWLN